MIIITSYCYDYYCYYYLNYLNYCGGDDDLWIPIVLAWNSCGGVGCKRQGKRYLFYVGYGNLSFDIALVATSCVSHCAAAIGWNRASVFEQGFRNFWSHHHAGFQSIPCCLPGHVPAHLLHEWRLQVHYQVGTRVQWANGQSRRRVHLWCGTQCGYLHSRWSNANQTVKHNEVYLICVWLDEFLFSDDHYCFYDWYL